LQIEAGRCRETGELREDRAEEHDEHHGVPPLHARVEFQEGIGQAIRKEALRRRGVITCADTRAPGAKLDRATLTALDRVLKWSLL